MNKEALYARVKRGDLTYYITLVCMVIMPLHYKYLPPFMILLGLSWIIQNYSDYRDWFRLNSKYKTLFIIFFIYYFWQIFGLIYSTDIKTGWSNVFGRLSLLVFPLILCNPGEKIKTLGFYLLRIFAVSTTLFIIYCFGKALYSSLSFLDGSWVFNPHIPGYDWLSYFYGPDLTNSIHPTYLAMYVLISVFISFESGYDSSLRPMTRFLWFANSIFLIISVYFISSRAAILAAIIMLTFYAIRKIVELKKNWLLWIAFILLLIFSLPLLRKNDRIKYFLSGFSNEQKVDLRKHDERIVVWESAIRIIRNNFTLGVGIGDVRTELVKEYDRIGEIKISSERLNAHNQFLEVFLENGIIGLSIFVILLAYMIYIAFSEKKLLFGLFIIMMLVFFMFETILYRMAGISFFSLFSFLLVYGNAGKNQIDQLSNKV